MQGTYLYLGRQSIANIYNKATTTVIASEKPVIQAPHCHSSGLWKMGLAPRDNTGATANVFSTESINALFDLPSTKQMAL